MARPARPERSRSARSSRQLSRFYHSINLDRVFGTHTRADVADIYLHTFSRVTELVAGSVAEALFLPGEPWPADSDRAQEHALASLVASSPESIEAFIDFCMAEAAALLRPREHIVRALTKELLVRRTMTGDE